MNASVNRAASRAAQFLHRKVLLLSTSDVRYDGSLYTVDIEQGTIALENVNCLGTEGRRHGDEAISPSDCTYQFIIFRAENVQQLSLVDDKDKLDLTKDIVEPLKLVAQYRVKNDVNNINNENNINHIESNNNYISMNPQQDQSFKMDYPKRRVGNINYNVNNNDNRYNVAWNPQYQTYYSHQNYYPKQGQRYYDGYNNDNYYNQDVYYQNVTVQPPMNIIHPPSNQYYGNYYDTVPTSNPLPVTQDYYINHPNNNYRNNNNNNNNNNRYGQKQFNSFYNNKNNLQRNRNQNQNQYQHQRINNNNQRSNNYQQIPGTGAFLENSNVRGDEVDPPKDIDFNFAENNAKFETEHEKKHNNENNKIKTSENKHDEKK